MGRILLVCRLAARDLRRRRAEAAMLLIAIMAATTTLTLGLLMHAMTSHPYDSTRAATAGPDVVASVFPPQPIGGPRADLAALTREVKSGRLRCALDVSDPEEPLPVNHPLRTLPGAIMTPHIGGGGRRTRGEMADAAMDELQRFFSGESVQHRVTTSMLSLMT